MLHTTLINEVLVTVAFNIIWRRRYQLPTMVATICIWSYLLSTSYWYDMQWFTYKENFSEHLACNNEFNTCSYYLWTLLLPVALDHSYSPPAPVTSQKLTKSWSLVAILATCIQSFGTFAAFTYIMFTYINIVPILYLAVKLNILSHYVCIDHKSKYTRII